jgi:hypothetical protein
MRKVTVAFTIEDPALGSYGRIEDRHTEVEIPDQEDTKLPFTVEAAIAFLRSTGHPVEVTCQPTL